MPASWIDHEVFGTHASLCEVPPLRARAKVRWQSGEAADCKSASQKRKLLLDQRLRVEDRNLGQRRESGLRIGAGDNQQTDVASGYRDGLSGPNASVLGRPPPRQASSHARTRRAPPIA